MPNYSAPLSSDVEIRDTELFSCVCLKKDTAKFAGKSASKAAAVEDDDDMDLFGSDDEEDVAAAAALQEKIAAEKAARKAGKGKGERSLIVLEVKPFDAETDLVKMAKGIKTIEHEGIQNWGQEHKLIPVAFGIKKLAISAVVYDNLMVSFLEYVFVQLVVLTSSFYRMLIRFRTLLSLNMEMTCNPLMFKL